MMKDLKKQYYILFVGLVFVLFLCSLFVGKYPLSLDKLMAGDTQSLRVFYTLRIPRSCMAILGGFALGFVGMIYQTIFKNPLASPDLIGVSSGASVGAAFAILFLPASAIFVTGSAFIGSILVVLLVLTLSTFTFKKNHMSIVLSGLAIQSFAQTLLMILKLMADPEKELAAIEYWIMGSLNGIILSQVILPFILISVCTFFLLCLHRHILLLSLEDDEAQLLGVSLQKMRILVLLLATLMVSSVVSVCGVISFVGLLAPHSARLLCHKHDVATLLLSGSIGALLLCIGDIFVRVMYISELPISIFTSLLGVPFLVYLLVRKEEYHE